MKLLSSIFLLITTTFSSIACDSCNMYEYLSSGNKSYFGLFYRYRLFSGIDGSSPSGAKAYYSGLHTSDENSIIQPSSRDFELYQTYELRFNYTFKEKYNLMLVAPLQKTTVYYDKIFIGSNPVTDSSFSFTGFGDIIIAFDKFNTKEEGKWKYITKIGAGLKLGTGKFEIGDYDETMQPGTGSTDFLLRGSLVGVYNQQFGISLSGSYKLNSSNSNKYKFGNATNMNVDLFYIGGTTFNWIPKIGGYYEYSGSDLDGDHTRDNTGGHSTMIQGGVDLKFKNFTLQTLFQFPILDKLNDNMLENNKRFTLGFIYNI